jgi:RNA polymerase sigma-70 factor (ECF subfamily)
MSRLAALRVLGLSSMSVESRDAATPVRGTVGNPSHAETFDDSQTRLRSIVDRDYEFLWRSLRRIGVPEGSVEDAAQKVLLVVARRLGDIKPGSEKAFLYRTAVNVARDDRRTVARRHELLAGDALEEIPSSAPDPAEQLDKARARSLLDRVLEALDPDLRSVFALYELEELTMAEIGSILDLPSGTVASRLRRAREEFQAIAKRFERGAS